MTLTQEEKQTIAALRKLDPQQRRDMVAYMDRQLTANRITARVSGIRKLRTVENRKVEKAYGTPLRWRPAAGGRAK